jgi:cytoskeleton protein RodZ
MSHASAVRVTAPTWVELRDGAGRTLWARTLAAGESASIEGALPLRLIVGNASAASVVFNGQPVDLRPWTRDNMASVEIK